LQGISGRCVKDSIYVRIASCQQSAVVNYQYNVSNYPMFITWKNWRHTCLIYRLKFMHNIKILDWHQNCKFEITENPIKNIRIKHILCVTASIYCTCQNKAMKQNYSYLAQVKLFGLLGLWLFWFVNILTCHLWEDHLNFALTNCMYRKIYIYKYIYIYISYINPIFD